VSCVRLVVTVIIDDDLDLQDIIDAIWSLADDLVTGVEILDRVER
jgi:phenylalanyl-tRNA synthetase beta subunit